MSDIVADRDEESAVVFLPRVLSGFQPTAAVHLGHFFGALKQHIDLHHEYPGQAFFLIADYHALTRGQDANLLRTWTIELGTTCLALGLDPNKAVLYRQSDVPECCELAWILACHTSTHELMRVPTYKAALAGSKPQCGGLLYYPLLMAADIFCVRATVVPVGADQRPNVEMARDIARRLNAAYKMDLLPVPEVRVSGFPTVPGIDGRKMSHAYDNCIALFERFDQLQEKVSLIKTDSKGKFEPKDPDTCNVFQLYSLVASAERTASMRRRYQEGSIGYQDAKRELMLTIQEYFGPFQERYHQLRRDPDFVADVLREGFRQAKEEAHATLDQIRGLAGLMS
jgi:tryptophanyl-tRNA synthetase